MGFFDKVNVFKKKEDDMTFVDNPTPLPHEPLSGQPSLQPHQGEIPAEPPGSIHAPPQNLSTELPSTLHAPPMSQDSSTGNIQSPPVPSHPLDDQRMTMPLGENIRQQRISAMHEAPSEAPEQNSLKKELELISSKLDYLKASLDAVNQRIVNLEHLTRQEMQQKGSYSEKIDTTKFTNPPM